MTCRADPLVRAGPPGPALGPMASAVPGRGEADEGVGRGPGGSAPRPLKNERQCEN